MRLRVTHNGMKVENFDNIDSIYSYIDSVLSNHRKLNPELVYNFVNGNTQILVYRYYTLYSEIFLIERL